MTELPTSKRMTDRELLRSCMEAMHIAHQQRGSRTDWSLMIEDIRRHLESSAHETSALPHASAALKDFMAHLGEIMSMEDGAAPADYLQRARDIREWCHDHQTLPKLEYSEHCGFCVRNKITVEVFGRPVVEPAEQLCNCGEFCNKSLGQPHAGTCRRLKQGLPVKATAPHAPIGSGQTGVCPHGVWLERKCDQCSPLNGSDKP